MKKYTPCTRVISSTEMIASTLECKSFVKENGVIPTVPNTWEMPKSFIEINELVDTEGKIVVALFNI